MIDIYVIDDKYGKEALQDGMEPMTKERAKAIFEEFFRFGEAMDPDAPDSAKGYKRAAGGVVYAPAKGLLYGGRTLLTGVVMGTASVVAGAGAMVGNVAMGVKEMGEAGKIRIFLALCMLSRMTKSTVTFQTLQLLHNRSK